MKRRIVVLVLVLSSACFAANDFSDAVAFYDFEDDLVDAVGGNNLADVGTPAYSTTHKEGSKSVDLELTDSDGGSLANASLSADFPGKSGTSNTTMSFCAWVHPETLPPSKSAMAIASKYKASAGGRSWMIRLFCDNADADTQKWELWKGYNSGDSYDTPAALSPSHAISANQWYHVTFTLSSAGAWVISVYDDTNATRDTASGTFANGAMSVSTTQFLVGARTATVGNDIYWDGLIDELVVFDRVLSVAEMNQVAAGTYGSLSGSGPRYYYRMMLQ